MKFAKIIASIFAGLILFTGCSSYDVEQDKTGIEIDDYLMFKTDKKLVSCHNSGQSGFGGVGNQHIYLPAGQRTYSFTGNSSESETSPFAVTTADGQTQRQPGFIKFTLTTDCDSLYDFWVKVGIKYNANGTKGWNNLLNDYFGVPISTALNDITGTISTWDVWYTNSAVRTKAQTDLLPVLQKALDESLGGDWIKVKSISFARPEPSDDLLKGLEASEKVKLENKAIEQRNKGLLSKYDAMRDCIKTKGLPQATCELMFLSENGDVTFFPFGSNLNVTR